jgi:VWFA-related protein
LACALLPCLSGPAVSAQIRTETRVVLVDAIVTDKQGDYIHGLTARDFRVFEDNKEQTIQSVSLEKGAVASRPHYLVLFFAPMQAAERMVARRAVSGFIDANAEENRKMAVASFNGEMRIGQNFTGDAGRLKTAVNAAMSSEVTTGITDSSALDTIRALGNLARSLANLQGRKTIVFINGGLSQSSVQKAELTAAIDACNKSDVAVYPIDLRPLNSGVTTTRSGTMLEGPATAGGMGRRGGGGGPQGDRGDFEARGQDAGMANQQVLFRLATGTGGFVIGNLGELQGGLQKIGAEQSESYILSYTPAPDTKEAAKTGACHTLRVKVDRGGTNVRARANYCESKPEDLLAGTLAGQDLERRAAGGHTGTVAGSMRLSYFYASTGVARVNVALEIPEIPHANAEIDFLGIASAPDGGVAARFSDALKLAPGSQGKPVHYEKEFRIAPGSYKFTMTFSSGGESFGKLEMPLTVDPRQGGELALSGLALSKETHPAEALNLGLAGLVESSTPLVTNGVRMVPSASNQFAKSDMAYVYFEVYAPDPASVSYGMRVLDAKTGEPKSDAGLRKLDVPKGGGDAIPIGSSVPISGLATGSYELEVTAVDAAGKQVRRTVDFEVK